MQKSKQNIRPATVGICLTAVYAALLCVVSPLTIPTPFGIGFTLQVLAVMIAALTLKPQLAAASQLVYTLLGVFGLPVFSGCQSGFGVIAGPTGGFIIGFIIASFAVSLLKGKPEGRLLPLRYIAVSVFVGIPCIYIPGITGFMLASGRDFWSAFALVAAAFIPFDIIKCIIAALAAVPLNKAGRRL